MTLVPENRTVLCEMVVPLEEETDVNGVFCRKENLPEYRIVKAAAGCNWLSEGDLVVCCSTGTAVKAGKSVQYLFGIDNVIGKVEER